MGSCISKCSPYHSPLPDDKLVISQSPATSTNPLYDLSIIKPPTPSSSSSLSLSSMSSSRTNSHSCSSASSSSKEASFSNEFLLSCAQKNPHIAVPHPQKQTTYAKKEPTRRLQTPSKSAKITTYVKKEPTRRLQSPSKSATTYAKKEPTRRLQSPSKSAKVTLEQFSTGKNQPFPVKRARSDSPTTFARQKSLRNGAYRSMASPTASRRGSMVGLPPAARKEKVRSPSPCRQSSTRHISREKEVSLHWVDSKEDANRRREVTFDQPLVEDVDNPLISMDCFIFL